METEFQKNTKVIITISGKRCDIPLLAALYKAGMDVVRINIAHQQIEGALLKVEGQSPLPTQK